MPTYTCTCRSGVLDASKKAKIAAAVTTAHAEITGAPLSFVQVIFGNAADGDVFIGGHRIEHDHLFVSGQIRAGRSAAVRKALIERLTGDIAREAGVPTFSVWIYINELPPAAMVEFGHVLPEPGDEAAWAAALPADDAKRLQRLGNP